MTQFRHIKATLAVAAVAALGVLGFAAPASAAPTIPDPAPTGSITVHKLLNPTGDLVEGNGLEDPNAPGTPLAGVEFLVQPIDGVDLRTTAGWQTAGEYADDPSSIPAGDLGAIVRGTTTAPDGEYTFDDLTIGAYLVTENLTAAQIAEGITPAAPFVVTVPITHPTDLDTWVYDVHVYPKNLQTTPDKTVDDGPGTTYQVGDLIDWTISAPVPSQETGFYAFKDPLVEHLVIPAPVADNVVVTLNDVALAAADYTFSYDSTTDNTLIVTLNQSGLDKVNAVVGTGQEIALTLTTEVVSLPDDGRLQNTGAVFPNEGFDINEPGVPTPEVESKFGEIVITKQDASTSELLAGAEFRVFASEADAKAYAADPTGSAGLPLSNSEGDSIFVTGTDGTATIFGLRASNWQDGAELTDPADFQNYWVLETKAPAGYELSTAPLGPITVSYDSAAPTELPVGTLTVPNVEKGTLPFTGGTLAAGLFYAVGGLILVGGVLLLINARRRRVRA